jgi:hypothetical protein
LAVSPLCQTPHESDNIRDCETWLSAVPSEVWICVQVYPGPTSWVIFSRPCGTVLAGNVYPALRAGLLSAVPSGLVPTHPDDRFVFSKCWPNRPIEKLSWPPRGTLSDSSSLYP